MNKIFRWGAVLFVIAALGLMSSPSAFAKKGGAGGGPPGFGKGEKKGWEGDKPPGWTHGKKKGWGEAKMPPGLAKKSGERKDKKDKKEKGKHKKEKKEKKDKDDNE